MATATRNFVVPPLPPPPILKSVTLELSIDEALVLTAILGRSNETVFGLDDPSRTRTYDVLSNALDAYLGGDDKWGLRSRLVDLSKICKALHPAYDYPSATHVARTLGILP